MVYVVNIDKKNLVKFEHIFSRSAFQQPPSVALTGANPL